MATRQEIIDDLRRQYGGAMNTNQLMRYLGYRDVRAAKKFMAGVPTIETERQVKYLSIDVGRRIYERMGVRDCGT